MAKPKLQASLDTNILLRLLLNDVPEQTKKAELFVKKHHCHISDLALTETVFVLEKIYLMPRENIADNITAIIRNASFSCNAIAFEKALPIYKNKKSVSINDCLLTTYAELNNATPLVTFDKDLNKAYPKVTSLLT